jgi:hypothetical protein
VEVVAWIGVFFSLFAFEGDFLLVVCCDALEVGGLGANLVCCNVCDCHVVFALQMKI